MSEVIAMHGVDTRLANSQPEPMAFVLGDVQSSADMTAKFDGELVVVLIRTMTHEEFEATMSEISE